MYNVEPDASSSYQQPFFLDATRDYSGFALVNLLFFGNLS